MNEIGSNYPVFHSDLTHFLKEYNQSDNVKMNPKSAQNMQNQFSSSSLEPLNRVQNFLLDALEQASSVLLKESEREAFEETVEQKKMDDRFENTLNLTVPVDTLNRSEATRDLLQKELQETLDYHQELMSKKDIELAQLESTIEELKSAQEKLMLNLKQSDDTIAVKSNEIKNVDMINQNLKTTLLKSNVTSEELSQKISDIETSNAANINILSTRIRDLEILLLRKDQVLKQFSETDRLLNRPLIANVNMNGVQVQSSDMSQNQKSLHLDILKANADTVIDDLKAAKAKLALLEQDSESNQEEISFLRAEVQRLEFELNELQSHVSMEKKDEDVQSERHDLHLEDLLGQMQVGLTSPSRTSETSNETSNQSIRMSTIFNQEDIEIEPALLNRLLDAAKRRIKRLKSTCETLKEENGVLRGQLDEKEIHINETYCLLQTANKRAAEAESKITKAGSNSGKIAKKLETIDQQRKYDMDRLRSIVSELTSIPIQVSMDSHLVSHGLLPALKQIVSELSHSHFTNSSYYFDTDLDSLISVAEVPNDVKLDISRYNTHLMDTLSLTISKMSDYISQIGKSVINMKSESQIYVKEIMKMKKEAVVRNLVTGVRDSVLMDSTFTKSNILEDTPSKTRSTKGNDGIPIRPSRSKRDSQESHYSLATSARLSGVSDRASSILDTLKRLKVEISRMQSQENPSAESLKKLADLKHEYRDYVQKLMISLKQDSSVQDVKDIRFEEQMTNPKTLSKGQELKDRLRQVTF